MSEAGRQLLPLCWEEIALRDLLLGIEAGKSFECLTRPAGEGEWGIIKVSAMTWGTFDPSQNKAVPFEKSIDTRNEIRVGDLLLSRANTVDLIGATVYVHRTRPRLLLSDKSMRLKAASPLNPQWLQLMLSSPLVRAQMSAVATGTSDSMRNISQEKVLELRLGLPPVREQGRIVAEIERLFSILDAGVAALKRVQANLKRYRASVLQAACEGRLVPTEAALARADGRDYESAETLLVRILRDRKTTYESVRPEAPAPAGKRSGAAAYADPPAPVLDDLPELPEGWTYCTALQTCSLITNGDTPAPENMTAEGDVPFIKVYNLTKSGALDFTIKPTYISRETHERELKRSRIVPGDILMNIVGPPLGKVSFVPTTFPEWNTNQAVTLFRPLETVNRRYLAICLLTEHVLATLTRTAKATAGQYNIALSKCRTLPIPLPPRAEQDRIVVEVERRLSVLDALESTVATNLKRAERLRQSILKRAFEGKLVPQDPNDEPASMLLERIRAERAASENGKARTSGRGRKSKAAVQPALELNA